MNPAKPIITTSWDDGHPLDLRVAEVLARNGLRGTFYVPLQPVAGQVAGATEMRELLRMGMEIGSHTVTHPVLTDLPEAAIDCELRDSRRKLEDLLGLEITSFCYPKGRFNSRVSRRAALAGYRVCRTTVDFQTSARFDPGCMPVSLHLFPHTRSAHCRHALRHGNWSGFWNWCNRMNWERDPERSAALMLAAVSKRGGVFHLWGHSWEIEEHGLWPLFERTAALMGQAANAIPMTNGEVGHAAQG
jgi:peptidoglycan-N-acetylglucosamine deacetylase